MVAQSHGHAQCEGSARCGVMLGGTISQREVHRCGFGEGEAGVVVGDDLAIVEVILSKVGFRSTGQSYLLLYPSVSSSSRKSRITFRDNPVGKQRLLEIVSAKNNFRASLCELSVFHAEAFIGKGSKNRYIYRELLEKRALSYAKSAKLSVSCL